MNKEAIVAAIEIGKVIICDSDIAKFVCGTYSDGSQRNLSDAIHGEYLSPKQKKKATKKKKKKKKGTTKFKL